MAIEYSAGPLLASGITAAATSAGYGQAPDRRRLYDFTDRILKIDPLSAPYFTFLSKTNKVEVDDSIFRYLQDRTISDLYLREVYLSANVNGGSAVTADVVYTFKVDDGAGASIDWLVKGNVLVVNTVYGTAGFAQVMVRVEDEPLDMGIYTQFSGRIIAISANITGYNVLADNDRCKVMCAYKEGTDSPDVTTSEMEDDFGYTQIFKTAWDLSETARATALRGNRSKWDEEGAKKAIEHKLKIENAFMFSMKARRNNINYTEGLIGEIVKNATVQTTGSTNLSYTADKAFLRSVALSEFTYDLFLRDFQIYFQAALGGDREVLALASPYVITEVNKLGGTAGFLHYTALGANATVPKSLTYNVEIKNNQSGFGHELTTIKTVHGSAHLVEQPLFSGSHRSLLVFVDLKNSAYRPLVGNGINRDTQLQTNIQDNDTDGRKDQYLTEAGHELGLPERNMLYSVEGL